MHKNAYIERCVALYSVDTLPEPVTVIALMLTTMFLLVCACASVVRASCSAVDSFEKLSESCVHGFSFLVWVGKLARGRGSRRGLFWVKALDGDTTCIVRVYDIQVVGEMKRIWAESPSGDLYETLSVWGHI